MSEVIARLNARTPSKPFMMKASDDKKTAEIIIYADIGAGWWGDTVSAKSFSDELAALPKEVETIKVRINSGGGDVFDGVSIYNRLKQHKAKIIVYVDGLAASIASIIALAGDEVVMSEGAMIMVHKPWTYTAGNTNDLEEVVLRLREVEEQLVGIYSRKTGLDREEIRSMLHPETWMGAEEAVEKGFADRVEGEAYPIAASIMDKKWIMRPPRKIENSIDDIARAEARALIEKIQNIQAGVKK